MTECNGCGCCCDPVALPYSKEEIRNMVPAESSLPPRYDGEVRVRRRDRRWILKELTEITRAEAEQLRPDMVGAVPRARLPGGGYSDSPSHYYRCANFDRDTRRCTAYDDRPDICWAYPPLEPMPPGMAPGLPPACSFRADYGLPVEEWTPVQLRPRM